MRLEEAYSKLVSALRSGQVVVIAGMCSVFYEGRSFSKLGDRRLLVMLKPDGSVIVHSGRGVEPVNWQPSGSKTRTRLDRERLVIEVGRLKPMEVLRIHFNKIFFMETAKLDEVSNMKLEGIEADLRDRIAKAPDILERGLVVKEVERRTRVGKIDIFAYDAEGTPVVVEVKKDTAGKAAVLQLKRYVEVTRREFGRARGILAAPSITRDAFLLLTRLGLEYRKVSLKGLRKVEKPFEEKG